MSVEFSNEFSISLVLCYYFVVAGFHKQGSWGQVLSRVVRLYEVANVL